MKVKQLIKELRNMPQDLEIRLFAGDHNHEEPDEGEGTVHDVFVATNKNNETFVALKP